MSNKAPEFVWISASHIDEHGSCTSTLEQAGYVEYARADLLGEIASDNEALRKDNDKLNQMLRELSKENEMLTLRNKISIGIARNRARLLREARATTNPGGDNVG